MLKQQQTIWVDNFHGIDTNLAKTNNSNMTTSI